MAIRKPKTDEPVATATEDGHAILGGRPMTDEFRDDLSRQQSGLPPRGSRKALAPEIPAGASLPSIAVARNVVGKEVARLRGQAEGLERSISTHPGAFQGNANPYMASVVQAHNAMTLGYKQQLADVRAAIERLERLTDTDAQKWAAWYLETHPGPIRG